MDIKTLEYMEERAKNGRVLVNTIDKLKKNIQRMDGIRKLSFIDHNRNNSFDTDDGNLTKEMKTAYQELVQKKIQSLEQQLAEL